MQFNNTSDTSNSLYHDTLFRLGIDRLDTLQYPLLDFTRSANTWYKIVNSWIWNNTGEWEYDDRNYNDLPIATTDLVTTPTPQRDYELPSYAQKIDRIEVCDVNGKWHKLDPIDKSEIDIAMTEFESSDGLPEYYDMMGSSILLYPTPSTTTVTEEGGLKAYFSRDISKFIYTDTTKEPGFISDFHSIISIGAAIEYASIYDIEKLTGLNLQLQEVKTNLEKFYGSRNRELKAKIKPKVKKWK